SGARRSSRYVRKLSTVRPAARSDASVRWRRSSKENSPPPWPLHPPAASVRAPRRLGRAQAALERGMARQEGAVEQLGFLHDDPAAGADDARKLAQRAGRVLVGVEAVVAPDP